MTKVIGLLLLSLCLSLLFIFESSAAFSGALRVLHWPAILLTVAGPIGVVLMATEWGVLRAAGRMLTGSSPRKIERQNQIEAHLLHQVMQQIYRSGTKALEKPMQEAQSATLRRVFRRVVARVPLRDVIDLVGKERDRVEVEARRSVRAASLGLRMAPSVGMLGTILGMVQLLSHIQDPSNIGSHMSLALLTTFYGLFVSLVVWTPLQNYLESILDARMRSFDQIEAWLEIMEDRKPIQYFEEQLSVDPNTKQGPAESKARAATIPLSTSAAKRPTARLEEGVRA